MREDEYDWVDDPSLSGDELRRRFEALGPEKTVGPRSFYKLLSAPASFALLEVTMDGAGTFDVVPALSPDVTFDARIAPASS